MLKRERKFYSEAFKERVLASYYSGNEPVSVEAARFDACRDTVGSFDGKESRLAKRDGIWTDGTEFGAAASKFHACFSSRLTWKEKNIVQLQWRRS